MTSAPRRGASSERVQRRTAASAVRRPNLKEAVADHLRELIFSGELRPGDKVDQDAVAEELGTSKLPVREALIALESEALIENVARRGSFVAPLEPDVIRDHYRIYGLVAGLAARHAAESLSDAELRELRSIIEKMQGLSEQESDTGEKAAELEENLNFRFHRMINVAGGTRRLISVLHLLAQGIPTRFYEFTTGWASTALDDHRDILAALEDRDAEAAERAMARHLERSGDYAVRLLTESGFWSHHDEGDAES